MSSKVSLCLKDLGYPTTTLENDDYALKVDAKVSSYPINIEISCIKELDCVFIRSKLELSSYEKKKLDNMDHNTRLRFLGHVKGLCMVKSRDIRGIYHFIRRKQRATGNMYDNFLGVGFSIVINHEEFNKKRFLKAISDMVKVLDLLKLEYTKLHSYDMKKRN